jgi:hypothetical protein
MRKTPPFIKKSMAEISSTVLNPSVVAVVSDWAKRNCVLVKKASVKVDFTENFIIAVYFSSIKLVKEQWRPLGNSWRYSH